MGRRRAQLAAALMEFGRIPSSRPPFSGTVRLVGSGRDAFMTDADSKITLKLEGDQAREGIVLNALDGFITHFTKALLYHYRASKSEPARRTGHPQTDEQLATSFRLVEFRTGSAIVVLNPLLADVEMAAMLTADVPTLAWTNVESLLATADSRTPFADEVVAELEQATRCLGKDGRFSVDYQAHGHVRSRTFDLPVLATLRAPARVDAAREHTITGNLHAIDLEPDQVAIRAASGVDWRCTYPKELQGDVLGLVGSRVWARGVGKSISARAGTLDVIEIHGMAEYEQTSLFTGAPVPLETLMQQQHFTSPQGLTAYADPEWEADEQSERFLEFIFADSE